MKQVILGTAGHIDHGKTSLIRALTGIDTDRLKEEKLRGITIELGFAYMDLPNGDRLGIVDVPGHERFVKHMVAGATGIDLVALVIAADEGVMPQTREHMEICELLQVKKGLVVLTKIDLVDDPDWVEMVQDDVTQFLKGTFLAGSPIIRVSAATGEGLPELQGGPGKAGCAGGTTQLRRPLPAAGGSRIQHARLRHRGDGDERGRQAAHRGSGDGLPAAAQDQGPGLAGS